jgi:hypothetical protein
VLVSLSLSLPHHSFINIIQSNPNKNKPKKDVLRDQSQENKFFFYELYQCLDDIEYHKTQPHYATWAKFKESGGVISSISYKTDGEFMS